MNYRVVLRIKVEEEKWIQVGSNHEIPWEARGLLQVSSGWIVLNQQSLGSASSLIPLLERGALVLTRSPESFLSYEVDCGPGTIRDAIAFYRGLVEDCRAYPYAELYGEIIL